MKGGTNLNKKKTKIMCNERARTGAVLAGKISEVHDTWVKEKRIWGLGAKSQKSFCPHPFRPKKLPFLSIELPLVDEKKFCAMKEQQLMGAGKNDETLVVFPSSS